MTKHNDQERALFEAWFAKEIEPSVSYGNPDILRRSYWTAWQARAQLPAGGAVPESPSRLELKTMLSAARKVYRLVDRAAVDYEAGRSALGYMEDIAGSSSYLISVLERLLTAAPHPVSGEQKPDMADAYCGAMEDRNIWKRLALEAEAKLRTYDQRIVDLGVLSMRTAVAKGKQPAAQDVLAPRDALANFIEYSVPGPYGCDGKWAADKKALVAALAAHRAQAQGGDA